MQTVPKGYEGSQVYTVSHSLEPVIGRVDPNAQLYHVNFKVYYQTIPGESLCVLGSIPELGSWKELKCHLKWTEGHIWQMTQPFVTSSPSFAYKYVLMDNEMTEMVKWESGIDRIAELPLLSELTEEERQRPIVFPTAADQTVAKAGIYRADESKLPKTKLSIKYVELNDEWESYMIRYTVFYPMDDPEDTLTMECDRTGMQVLKMEKTKEPSDWMMSKYGQPM